MKLVILGVALAVLLKQSAAPRLEMATLTVPPERLPAGCALSRTNSVDSPTNPWMGTSRPIIAAIRERVGGPALALDAPPLGGRTLARYRLQLADGVEEGYTATYEQAEWGRELIIVYGLRFSAPIDSPKQTTKDPRVVRLAIGPVVVVLHGDGGECFKAIATHLESLGR